MNTNHTIEDLCERSHTIAKEKGWLAEDGKDARSFAGACALVHSELSEALEEYRKHKPVGEIYYEVTVTSGDVGGKTEMSRQEMASARDISIEMYGSLDPKKFDAKPAGIPIEIADVVIRIAQRVGSNSNPALLQSYVNGNHFRMDKDFDFETFIARAHRSVSQAYDECESETSNDETARYVVDDLADTLSMCFAFCKAHDVDLWAAIDEKEAYNRTRNHRHNGKRI